MNTTILRWNQGANESWHNGFGRVARYLKIVYKIKRALSIQLCLGHCFLKKGTELVPQLCCYLACAFRLALLARNAHRRSTKISFTRRGQGEREMLRCYLVSHLKVTCHNNWTAAWHLEVYSVAMDRTERNSAAVGVLGRDICFHLCEYRSRFKCEAFVVICDLYAG